MSKSYLVLHAASQVSGVRLKWHKIVHFGTVDQPTWNAIQFTHLLCFARTLGLPRVGVTTETDPVVDLGSTLPDILERGSKPPGLRKGACCPTGMVLLLQPLFAVVLVCVCVPSYYRGKRDQAFLGSGQGSSSGAYSMSLRLCPTKIPETREGQADLPVPAERWAASPRLARFVLQGVHGCSMQALMCSQFGSSISSITSWLASSTPG